ncbi:MAG: hypothetical protein GX629_09420 [Phycisphaerae bacterium]|nr:hypothetical protein [Phycisphaerae bacterium]
MTDLFDPRWQLEELSPSQIGGYIPAYVSDLEKEEIWTQYRHGNPSRVPMLLDINNRVVLLDHRINAGELSYQKVFSDPEAMLKTQLLFEYVARKRYHHFCDYPVELPDAWHLFVHFQNVFEAVSFGCSIDFHPNQVPDTTSILSDDNKHAIFEIDISRPLECEPFKTICAMTDFLREYVKDKTFLDRPIVIDPPGYTSSDGPLTVAMNVRGPGILLDLVDDPDYAGKLFRFIVQAALNRRNALIKRYNLAEAPNGLADDSIALIGTDQYREMVLPHHRYWYESTGAKFGQRFIHLCGDATRHFPVLKEELGVTTFDTGFPVNFHWLRQTLGPEVEILGGVEIGLLINGTPEQIYHRSQEILASGIMEGGRFIFREGNNLPPNVPWANIAAMYKAVQNFGRY